MPLLVRCPGCAQSLQVADSAAGQRVRCPRCQTTVQVNPQAPKAAPMPVPPTPAPQKPALAPVRFSCTQCKRPLLAKPEQIGSVIRCPQCQTTLRVPAPVAIPLSEAMAPKPTPAAPRSVPPGEGRPLTPPVLRRGRPMALWIGAAACLLVLVGASFGIRSLLSRSAVPQRTEPGEPAAAKTPSVSDLAFVPSDVQAIFSVRVADLWNSPIVKSSWDQLPDYAREQAQQMEKDYDFHMTDFERATVVWKDSVGDVFWAVLKTTRPRDQAWREKLLSRGTVKFEERTYEGFKYFFAKAPQGADVPAETMAVYVASDEVFVAGPEPGLKAALDYFKTKNPEGGPLGHVLPRIEKGQSQILIAGAMTAAARDMLGQQVQGVPDDIRSLLSVQTALGEVVFQDQTVKLETVSTFPDRTTADQAQRTLTQYKDQARLLLRLPPEQADDPNAKKMLELILGLVNSLTIEAQDASVVMRAKIDLGPLMPTILDLLRNQVRPATGDTSGDANLKRLALALQAYHDAHGRYPPAAGPIGAGNTAVHSWRVAILPYLGEEEKALYKKFDFTKAWDDEATNKPLLGKMPKVFAHPAIPVDKGPRGFTPYQIPVGPDAAFEGERKVTIGDIADGPSRTILLVESRGMVPWTAPVDVMLPGDAKGVAKEMLPSLGVVVSDTFPVAMFDGTVRRVKRMIDPQTLFEAMTPNDGKGLPLKP